MKELLGKISSYNVFNYLLPGIVFCVLGEYLTTYNFIQEEIVIGVFFYYFIGLIISRIGSLFLEPILKKIKFLNFASYSDFVSASKNDEKLLVLSEANNMYRTICALLLSLVSVKLFEKTVTYVPQIENISTELLVLGLVILFLFSYRKQTQYITKRIKYGLEDNKGAKNA